MGSALLPSAAVLPQVALAGLRLQMEMEMPIAKEAKAGWLAAWLVAEYQTCFQHRWFALLAFVAVRPLPQGGGAFLLKVRLHRR